ncbi:MAG TPA: Hsp20/alpha crystallin family protein [Opitutaceae bacterium]
MTLVRYAYPAFRSLVPANRFQRSPWSGLESEIDRLFDTALGGFAPATNRFPVDLYEDEANTYVRAELPGVNRDNINVEVADGVLTLTVTQKTPANGDTPEQATSFARSVSVGDRVDTTKISAAYENGVLTVTLPKPEAVKPKKIAIAVK